MSNYEPLSSYFARFKDLPGKINRYATGAKKLSDYEITSKFVDGLWDSQNFDMGNQVFRKNPETLEQALTFAEHEVKSFFKRPKNTAHQRGYEQMWEDILAKHRINSMGSSSNSSGGPKIFQMIFRGLPQEITQ